jgi:hypothetical protein
MPSAWIGLLALAGALGIDLLVVGPELAAARTRVLDLATIRSRLSLSLLAGGAAERPERHRSVAASLAWSHDLSSPAGRTALTQLSVFEGGFAIEAAEAVIDLSAFPCAPDVVLVLEALADKSLLRAAGEEGADTRFAVYATIQDYAREQLDRRPESRAAAEARHGQYFARLGASEEFFRLVSAGSFFTRDLDNFLAAGGAADNSHRQRAILGEVRFSFRHSSCKSTPQWGCKTSGFMTSLRCGKKKPRSTRSVLSIFSFRNGDDFSRAVGGQA